MNTQKKYSIAFAFTGILYCLYSFIVKGFFPNDNIGAKQGLGDFFESDFFLWVGFSLIFLGTLYFAFYKIDKIQLIDKLTARHYWFIFPMLIVLMSVPVLDTYYPTSEHRGSLIYSLVTYVMMIAVLLFLASFFVFFHNIVKSTIAYFSIKRKWRN